jgi:kynurenine formamidase
MNEYKPAEEVSGLAAESEPRTYAEQTEVEFLGRRFQALDLSREISPEIPVYPGHAKIAFWTHLSHEESKLRLGDSPFSYTIKGLVMCDHVSTHVDAISHLNRERQDLTIDRFPLEYCFTAGVWLDLSEAPPRTHISLDMVRRAMERAGLDRLPERGSLLYYTGVQRHWDDAMTFNTQYPGLDEEASRWILDQGVVNVLTDAVSTDNPADPSYPNHRVHAEYLISHTEVVNNIERIPMHSGFWVVMLPLRLVGLSGSPARVVALWE